MTPDQKPESGKPCKESEGAAAGVKHRHLNTSKWTAATIDSVLERGDLPDWRELFSAVRENPDVAELVRRVASDHDLGGASILAKRLVEKLAGKKEGVLNSTALMEPEPESVKPSSEKSGEAEAKMPPTPFGANEAELSKAVEHLEWVRERGLDLERQLLKNIKERLPQLEELLQEADNHDDEVYRFYHFSFKVYHLQYETKTRCLALGSGRALLPRGLRNAERFSYVQDAAAWRAFQIGGWLGSSVVVISPGCGPGSAVEVYLIHAWILGISSMIWRRILVRSDSSIAELHHILQVAFGWSNLHLHQFIIRGKRYGISKIGGVYFSTDAHTVRLSDFHFRVNERFRYQYDFGDLWEHQLRVERKLPVDAARTHPVLVGGNGRRRLRIVVARTISLPSRIALMSFASIHLYRLFLKRHRASMRRSRDIDANAPEAFQDLAPEPVRTTQKPGRNDSCPCGSGKKYKKCCGRN